MKSATLLTTTTFLLSGVFASKPATVPDDDKSNGMQNIYILPWVLLEESWDA